MKQKMGYNYRLLAYTQVGQDDVLLFKDMGFNEIPIDKYHSEYDECYYIEEKDGYLWKEGNVWFFGIAFNIMKDVESTLGFFLINEINRSWVELSQKLNRPIRQESFQIKYGSEGHPLYI